MALLHLRLASLPRGLQLSVQQTLLLTSRATPRLFSTHFQAPRSGSNPFRRRQWLYLLSLGGGISFLLYPRQRTRLPDVLASPTCIPVPPPVDPHAHFHRIQSVAELHDNRSILGRILAFLHSRIWEPVLTARRFLYLCIIFAPVIIATPLLIIGKLEDDGYGEDKWGALWSELLVHQLQAAGPTFIKLSQWAASRADLFPAALCDRLGALHSSSRPHSIEHTKRVIESVFKRKFEDLFVDFEEKPIGSGAIAQVYRASLRHPRDGTPTTVAIKILHPHADTLIRRDVSIMTFFASLINLFPNMEWLSLPEEVQVFGHMMNEQLDLSHEARNLRQFASNFQKRKAAVTFPRPLDEWSSKDILVEEFENALPLKAFLRNPGGPFDQQIATLGLDAFLNMLLLDNFVHSDLHPGNIMIKFYKPSTRFVVEGILSSIFNTQFPEKLQAPTLDVVDSDAIVSRLRPLSHNTEAWIAELEKLAKDGYAPELVFIDTGLASTLNGVNRRNFLDLFKAIAEFDGYRAGKLMVERCRTPHLAINTETFALKLQHLVLSVKSRTFSLARIKISDILIEVMRSVREHHVKMEGDFVNTVISVLLLEGIGRQLDPGMDLFKSALPILRKVGRQMSAREAVQGDVGMMIKVWLWLETRELINSAFRDADDMIRYDWLTPNV